MNTDPNSPRLSTDPNSPRLSTDPSSPRLSTDPSSPWLSTDPSSPWLTGDRHAGRRHLAALRRDSTPVQQTTALHAGIAAEVAAQWAALMHWDHQPLGEENVVLCATQREAVALGLGTLLQAGDTLLVAQPCAPQALAVALTQGARYVDVGRLASGQVDSLAVARAAQFHGPCVAWAEAPAWTAADDVSAMLASAAPLRAVIADCSAAAWPTQLPPATAVIVGLRDPDVPAQALLWAVVASAHSAAILQALWGPTELPLGPLAQALAVVRGWQAQPQWVDRARHRLAERAAELRRIAAGWPGVRVFPSGDLRVAVSCAAGDPQQVLALWRPHALAVAAYAAQPMRYLAIAEVDG